MAANRLQRDDDRRLNLEQQKIRAKELLRAVRRSEPEAIARVQAHHPQAREGSLAAAACKLSDAQLVIARELGVASWPKLKAHIERLDRARDAIVGRRTAPDRDSPTVHIRCGSDIRQPLKDAGFAGDFLEFSDPLWRGPLLDFDEHVRIIAEAAGIPPADVATKLRREHDELAVAADRYGRIVIWCEHDPYDQLCLARVLAEFAGRTRLPQIELIAVDGFPAIERFIGLGQLSPAALRLLWEGRLAVSPRLLALGATAWDALRDPSPRALHAIAASGTPELPMMAGALFRHLQELPHANGLSATQEAVLRVLRDGPQTVSRLFWIVDTQIDALPFMGDLFFAAVLRDMQRAVAPPVRVDEDTSSQPWPRQRLSLTPSGMTLLDGGLDWMSLDPPERWVGGVRIASGAPVWRWSRSGQLVYG
jgi:hypothetical protein